MGMITSLNVFQSYTYQGAEHSSDVLERIVGSLGGKTPLRFECDDENYGKQSNYIITDIVINGLEINATNMVFDDDYELNVGPNEIIFFVKNWDSCLTIEMINAHHDALKELESRIKAIDPGLVAHDISAFASYS